MNKWINVLVVTVVLCGLTAAQKVDSQIHKGDIELVRLDRQVAQKKEITPESHDRWKTIEGASLSNDGQWVAYTLTTPMGDGELIVRSTQNEMEWHVSRGRIRGSQAGTKPAQITADSRFVLFSISADKGGGSRGSASSMGIMSLPNGKVSVVPQVSSSETDNTGRYVAYLLSPINSGPSPQPQIFRGSKLGTELVLRDLHLGWDVRMPNVRTYLFDGKGHYLAYSVFGEDANKNGVYVRRLKDGQVAPLLTGKGGYYGLTFDAAGKQIAFLSDRDDQESAKPRLGVYYSSSPMRPAKAVVPAKSVGEGKSIVLGSQVRFTHSMNALVFGIGPSILEAPRKEMDSATPVFDLWHWRDFRPQNLQKTDTLQTLSYLSIYHIASHRWTQLASEAVPNVIVTNNGRYAVGLDQRPYVVEVMSGQCKADLYLIETISGHSRLLRKAVTFDVVQGVPTWRLLEWGNISPIQLSPGSRYLLTFEDSRWLAYNLTNGNTADLTGRLSRANIFKNPYGALGIAGWTKDDKKVLIYSNDDLWEIDPDGRLERTNLTKTIALNKKYRCRIWPDEGQVPRAPVRSNLDSESRLLVTLFDRETMATGFSQIQLGMQEKASEGPLMFDKRVRLLTKLKPGAQFLVTLETFGEFPDLWTGYELNRLKKISDANPQQAEYYWGGVELVEFPASSGLRLKGLLYKPENFDFSRRYPMLVNIYQDSTTERLHNYRIPQPMSGAEIEGGVHYLLSKGYVVFEPEIESLPESPGAMITKTVEQAVKSIIQLGFVNPARIGLMGNSFGGYEVASIVGRTHMFRAAAIGYGTVNLVSAYSDLNSIGPHFLERGQLRLGGSIWEKPFSYLNNSPIFLADRIKTPMLMIYNDADYIVPFQQGIDFYTALRRNGKEVYLFNYTGEGHGLLQNTNRLHWTRIFNEFFDYFLNNAPKPYWMEHGIPYTEKGDNLGWGIKSANRSSKN